VTGPSFTPKGLVFRDEDEKKRLETRNGVIQARFIFQAAAERWPVNADLLLELQRLAVNQIYRCAGHFRDDAVKVEPHQPPHHSEVRPLVDGMFQYLTGHWETRSAIHLAAYAMWRLNWIHPFFGGNGRAARGFSYLILCLHLGFVPPAAEQNLPELIVDNRDPYYSALQSADKAWIDGQLDLSEMETLISSLLARQLAAVHYKATGQLMPE
jgi:Fic family protein